MISSNPSLRLPPAYAGQVFIKEPGRVLYRALEDGQITSVDTHTHIARAAARPPFELTDVRDIFQESPTLKVEYDSDTDAVQITKTSPRKMALPSAYGAEPADKISHARFPENLAGQFVILRSSGSIFFVSPGGYLLSWGGGTYLSRNALRGIRPLEFAEIHKPEETAFLLGSMGFAEVRSDAPPPDSFDHAK